MLLRSGPAGLCSGVSMPSFPVSVWAYSRCDRFSEPLPFDTAGVDRVGRGEGRGESRTQLWTGSKIICTKMEESGIAYHKGMVGEDVGTFSVGQVYFID